MCDLKESVPTRVARSHVSILERFVFIVNINESSGPSIKELIESHIAYPSDNQLKKKVEAEILL